MKYMDHMFGFVFLIAVQTEETFNLFVLRTRTLYLLPQTGPAGDDQNSLPHDLPIVELRGHQHIYISNFAGHFNKPVKPVLIVRIQIHKPLTALQTLKVLIFLDKNWHYWTFLGIASMFVCKLSLSNMAPRYL